KSNKVSAVLRGQRDPRRHVAVIQAALKGVVKVLIQGQRACWSRTALEGGCDKIARQDVKVRSIFSVAIAAESVTAPTVTVIELPAGGRVTGVLSDVRFLWRIAVCHHGGVFDWWSFVRWG